MRIEETDVGLFLEKIRESYKDNSLEKNLEQFKDPELFQNECMFIVDFTQNEIVYKKGFKNVLGYRDEKITLDFLFKNIHPEDADIVNRIFKAPVVYCLENPDPGSNNLLFLMYRRKKRDSTYIHVLSQSSVYETDKSGKLTVAHVRFQDVSFMGCSQNVKWSFKANNLNKEVFRKEVYRSYQDFFTNREIEIIIEIEKGLTNLQIAEKLNISEHTVATHRKKILKKSNCHHAEELVLFCKDKYII